MASQRRDSISPAVFFCLWRSVSEICARVKQDGCAKLRRKCASNRGCVKKRPVVWINIGTAFQKVVPIAENISVPSFDTGVTIVSAFSFSETFKGKDGVTKKVTIETLSENWGGQILNIDILFRFCRKVGRQ